MLGDPFRVDVIISPISAGRSDLRLLDKPSEQVRVLSDDAFSVRGLHSIIGWETLVNYNNFCPKKHPYFFPKTPQFLFHPILQIVTFLTKK